MLHPIIDDLELRTAGVYKILCEYKGVYIGQMDQTIAKCLKEHKRNLRLLYPDKSAVAQHALDSRHCILFDNITILDCTSHYEDELIKEAIEIKLEGNNLNRNSGWIPCDAIMTLHGTRKQDW